MSSEWHSEAEFPTRVFVRGTRNSSQTDEIRSVGFKGERQIIVLRKTRNRTGPELFKGGRIENWTQVPTSYNVLSGVMVVCIFRLFELWHVFKVWPLDWERYRFYKFNVFFSNSKIINNSLELISLITMTIILTVLLILFYSCIWNAKHPNWSVKTRALEWPLFELLRSGIKILALAPLNTRIKFN